MKKRTTRRALVMSLLSLLLCCSMLVGTTFAWFTDSVTSGKNKIVAGNLDVELYYQNDTTSDWTKVGTETNVFKTNTLWEPGHTEVVKLKVVNEGTLALKYQLGVNIEKETASVNKDGNAFRLSDYIKFAVIEGDQTYSREEAVEAAEASASALNIAYNSGTLSLAPTDAKVVTMVVYMPTTVGNEANYGKDQPVPEILLGLKLNATQLASEEDSFGADYDEPAVYADYYVRTQAELEAVIAALEPGKTVALYAGSYTLPMNDSWYKATDLPAGTTLVGAEAGVEVAPTASGSAGVGEQGRIQAENYTFQNITFTATVSPDGYGQFIDCVFAGYNGLRQGAYKGTTRFVGCEFLNPDGWAFHTEYLYGADVYFEGCSFNGLVEFTDTIAETNKVYFNNCAFLGANRTSSGKIFYAWKNNAVITNCAGYDASLFAGCTAEANTKTYVADAAALKAAVAGGAKDILAINATFDDKISLGSDVDAAFVGCSFTGNNNWGYVNNATFEGCTFDSAEAALHFDRLYGELLVKDCLFTAGKVQIGTDGSSSATFEGCTFGPTVQTSIWSEKGMRFYCPTTFVGCEFNNRVVLAGSNGLPLTFVSCTMNGGEAVYYTDLSNGIIRGGNTPDVTVK